METTATTNTAATPQTNFQGDKPPRKQYPPRYNADGSERPYRGRGRGGFRNQHDNQDGGQVESSDNFYSQRPGTDSEFRGRGQYRGRGARGRGNWQSARPAYRGDLNDDEEIITVTPAQNNFINAMQKLSHEQNFGLSVSARPQPTFVQDDYIVRICVEHEFNEAKVRQQLDTQKTERKYQGLKDFEWSEAKSRQEIKNEKIARAHKREEDRERRKQMALKQQQREEQDKRRAEKKAEMEARRAEKEAARALKEAEKAKEAAAEAQPNSNFDEEQKEEAQPLAEAIASEVINNDSTPAPVETGNTAEEKTQKPKREKIGRKRSNEKKQGARVMYKAKKNTEEETAGPAEVSAAAESVEQSVAEPVAPVEEKPKPAKEPKVSKKEAKAAAKEEAKVAPVAADTQPAQAQVPQMPQIPQMPGMMPMQMPQMNMAPPEGMTMDQQNLYNQQLIMQQQMMLHQYHQYMSMMMMQQQ